VTGRTGGHEAVFLDRDGTVAREVGYLTDLSRLALVPGAGEAVRRINRAGMLAVLVTNQSGAARGLFPLDAIDRAHERLRALLAPHGARLDAIYVCPHLEGGVVPDLAVACDCRKPKAGLFARACADLAIDAGSSYAVGDSARDLIPPASLGARTVGVRTGYDAATNGFVPDHVADNLLAAVDWLLANRAARRARAKVVDARAAADAAREARADGRRVVLVVGAFDLLDASRIGYLRTAREHGNFLVCAVHDDASARALLGDGRPVLPLSDRMELVAALRGVDVVFPTVHAGAAPVALDIAPDVVVAGSESPVEDKRLPPGVAVVHAKTRGRDVVTRIVEGAGESR
jgi:D-glycero-D-manno-heptose 1,7-bisphosphate phosphatase